MMIESGGAAAVAATRDQEIKPIPIKKPLVGAEFIADDDKVLADRFKSFQPTAAVFKSIATKTSQVVSNSSGNINSFNNKNIF